MRNNDSRYAPALPEYEDLGPVRLCYSEEEHPVPDVLFADTEFVHRLTARTEDRTGKGVINMRVSECGEYANFQSWTWGNRKKDFVFMGSVLVPTGWIRQMIDRRPVPKKLAREILAFREEHGV